MSYKTPEQIQAWLDANLYRLDLPQQYLGDEPNTYQKKHAPGKTSWLITASWPYEQGAGNSSIPAVYKTINDTDHLADRWYLPATPRDMKNLERDHVPAFGIESKHQAQDFDVIATSISYPVLILNFIKTLQMSGIAPRRQHRDQNSSPFIVVGGQAYGAPEPLSPIIDAFWCGEVEEAPNNPGMLALNQRIQDYMITGLWQSNRALSYENLAREFPFLYFPQFIQVDYHYEDRSKQSPELDKLSKQVSRVRTSTTGMRLPISRRYIRDLNEIDPLTNPPLLYSDPGMGAGDVEVGRGCPAWCSFCALTYRQKPYRQRDVEYTVSHAQELVKNTGALDLTPFSPDFPMHTQRKRLIAELLQVSDTVDAPAMRVDDFIADDSFILLQVHGGLTAVSLGVEGNSQRMRDLVGKGAADKDIITAVTRGIRAGLKKVKLFMIGNLPGEDEGDVLQILHLAKELADLRERMNAPEVRIQFSWTPLMIEANTPFQWFAVPTNTRAIGDVWEELRDLKVEFKLGSKAEINKTTLFQLCQRCSRDQGEAIADVLCLLAERPGGACWGGVPKKIPELGGIGTAEALDQALRDRGFHNGLEDAFDERDQGDLFGWEFIDQGVNKGMLWKAFAQMREFLLATDSHSYDESLPPESHGNEWIERCDTRCYGKQCGACEPADLRLRQRYIRQAQTDIDVDLHEIRPIDQRSVLSKWRGVVYKNHSHRLVGNDHWRYAVRRAISRALYELESENSGTDPFQSQKAHTGQARHLSVDLVKRQVKFVSDEVVYRDWTHGKDYLELSWTKPVSQAKLIEILTRANKHLVGLEIWPGTWQQYPVTGSSLRSDVDLVWWSLEISDPVDAVIAALEAFRDAEVVLMTLKNAKGYFGGSSIEVNAKDLVPELWLVADGHRVHLNMLVRGRPSPYNVYAAIMGRASWIGAAKHSAVRVDAFVATMGDQEDFLRPRSQVSGDEIPVNLSGEPFHDSFTPVELAEITEKVLWRSKPRSVVAHGESSVTGP